MTKTHAKKATNMKQALALPSRKASNTALKADPKAPATGATENSRATKIGSLIAQLRQRQGATLAEIAEATGWQHHSIRGAISGHIKKKLGLTVASTKDDQGARRYRIAG